MTFQHQYAVPGTYTITISADWTGLSIAEVFYGHATKTDTVQAVTQCNPVILTQPSNQVVLAGATAQFSVNATSYFPIFYQWYFNGTNPFVGPIHSTLTLPNVRMEAAGLYSVLVFNAYGSATSSLASLTIVNPLVSGLSRDANGSVVLTFEGLPNSTTRVWAAINLEPPILWEPIFTNDHVGTGGTWQFTDTNATNYPTRYYRFSTP